MPWPTSYLYRLDGTPVLAAPLKSSAQVWVKPDGGGGAASACTTWVSGSSRAAAPSRASAADRGLVTPKMLLRMADTLSTGGAVLRRRFQIGRASCRERGWVSGGAGAFDD